MSDLDDRLRAILDRVASDGFTESDVSYQEYVDALKQAFADEEIKKFGEPISEQELSEITITNIKDFKTMTGQEWYDRLQVAKMGVVLNTGTQDITRRCVFEAWDKADEAAKRAAGLTDA